MLFKGAAPTAPAELSGTSFVQGRQGCKVFYDSIKSHCFTLPESKGKPLGYSKHLLSSIRYEPRKASSHLKWVSQFNTVYGLGKGCKGTPYSIPQKGQSSACDRRSARRPKWVGKPCERETHTRKAVCQQCCWMSMITAVQVRFSTLVLNRKNSWLRLQLHGVTLIFKLHLYPTFSDLWSTRWH